MTEQDYKIIDEIVKDERECGQIGCDFDDYENDLGVIAEGVGMETKQIEDILDAIDDGLQKGRMHADLWEGEPPYVECTKDPEPIRKLLKKLGVKILDEFESSGSDYDSYIIQLGFYAVGNTVFKSQQDLDRAKECLEYYRSQYNY